MEKQESKPNPELQRVAELLRPLWPGVVMEQREPSASGARRYSGRRGSVVVAVAIGDSHGEVTVTVNLRPVAVQTWTAEDGMSAALGRATQGARAALADLAAALGLEVSDVAR